MPGHATCSPSILREKHPVPTVEETLQENSGAKVFFKLDLNMVFYQIERSPGSRDITTFAGFNGLYRYKRFTIWSEYGHREIPGHHLANTYTDDIRIVGTSEGEHDERLDQVMRKLEENGLTLNYQKCRIGVTSTEYLEYVLN